MKCQTCDSENIASKIVDSIDRHPCEISYHCKDCGAYVDYWAYGYYQSEMDKFDRKELDEF